VIDRRHLAKRIEAVRQRTAGRVQTAEQLRGLARRPFNAGATPPAEEAPPAQRPPPPSGPLTASPRPDVAEALLYRRDIPAGRMNPRKPPEMLEGPHVELTDAVAGQETPAPGGGRAFVVTEPVRPRGDGGARLCAAFAAAFAAAGSPVQRHLAELDERTGAGPDDLLFLDLETAGLSSAPLFLIGAMSWEDDGLVVRQYLARDYAEERAVLRLFAAAAADKHVLVSFNGKSFDLPYLRARAAANAVALPAVPFHLDLLHVSRRAWGHALPDCRLQTLERYLCRRYRDDDIPGHAIPEAYHAFVRTRNAARMARILRHNLLDLLTLADLLTRLPGQ